VRRGAQRLVRLILIIALTVPGAAASASERIVREPSRASSGGSIRVLRRARWSGACPCYWRDHIVPLACGSLDSPGNMQWQTTAEAKAKYRWETKGLPLPLIHACTPHGTVLRGDSHFLSLRPVNDMAPKRHIR
jgi:hypothetical protein